MQAGLILTLCCLLFKVFIVRKQTKRKIETVALHKDQTDVSETSLNAPPSSLLRLHRFMPRPPRLARLQPQPEEGEGARSRSHRSDAETRQQLRRA